MAFAFEYMLFLSVFAGFFHLIIFLSLFSPQWIKTFDIHALSHFKALITHFTVSKKNICITGVFKMYILFSVDAHLVG